LSGRATHNCGVRIKRWRELRALVSARFKSFVTEDGAELNDELRATESIASENDST